MPSDRTILVERFRDELGDWRLVVHSPFGAQVNGPWALAIAARMRERRGVEVHASGADDGIVLRLPDTVDDTGAEVVPTAEDVLLDPAEVEQIVVAELGGSSLYASRFRECAARALLLPRRDPKRRSPLWQQRQKSAQLLAVAGKYEQFPVTLEAMRECVQDVYDLPGLRGLMGDIAARKVRVTEVVTASPSPFARSLLFGYVGMFLYETDAPLAERRAAALSLDSTLLAELLGSEAIRELLDPEVVTEVEQSLQRLAPDRHARDAEGAADLLRFLGPLSTAEAGARGVAPEWLTELEATRRVIRVRVARRGAVDLDRGRRSRPRRARRAAARRRARDVHRAGAGSAGRPAAAPRPHARAVPGGRGGGPLRPRRRRGLRRAGPAGRDRQAGPRRAAARRPRDGPRRRHRVLRRRGAAAAAAGLAGPAAVRGRAGRAAGAGPVPAGVAGRAGHPRRPARADAAGAGRRRRPGGGRAAGRGPAAGQRARVAHPARAAARLHPGAARRADRGGRGHLDRLRRAGGRRRVAGGRADGRRGPAAPGAGSGPRLDTPAPGAARRARAAGPRSAGRVTHGHRSGGRCRCAVVGGRAARLRRWRRPVLPGARRTRRPRPDRAR